MLEKEVHHVASQDYTDEAASVVYYGHGVMLLDRLEQLLHRRIMIQRTRVGGVDDIANQDLLRYFHIHALRRNEILQNVIIPEHSNVFAVRIDNFRGFGGADLVAHRDDPISVGKDSDAGGLVVG